LILVLKILFNIEAILMDYMPLSKELSIVFWGILLEKTRGFCAYLVEAAPKLRVLISPSPYSSPFKGEEKE